MSVIFVRFLKPFLHTRGDDLLISYDAGHRYAMKEDRALSAIRAGVAELSEVRATKPDDERGADEIRRRLGKARMDFIEEQQRIADAEREQAEISESAAALEDVKPDAPFVAMTEMFSEHLKDEE